MARPPDEVIERLKGEVSLTRLVETAGVTLKRHGADLLGLCRFHDDHEPSLVTSPDKNLWHCLVSYDLRVDTNGEEFVMMYAPKPERC